MHAAAAHALDDRGVGHVDLEHVVDRHVRRSSSPRLAGSSAESRRTDSRSRSRAPCSRSLTSPMMMSSETSAPLVHDLLRGKAERRARLHGGAQHVAGRDLRNAVGLLDEGRPASPCRRPGGPSRISRMIVISQGVLLRTRGMDAAGRAAVARRLTGDAGRASITAAAYSARTRSRSSGVSTPGAGVPPRDLDGDAVAVPQRAQLLERLEALDRRRRERG